MWKLPEAKPAETAADSFGVHHHLRSLRLPPEQFRTKEHPRAWHRCLNIPGQSTTKSRVKWHERLSSRWPTVHVLFMRLHAVQECTSDTQNSKLDANDHNCYGHWISFLSKPQQTNLTALQKLSPCTQFRYRRCRVDAQSCHDASSNVLIQLTCQACFNPWVETNLPCFLQMLTLGIVLKVKLVKRWSSSLPFNMSKEKERCEFANCARTIANVCVCKCASQHNRVFKEI